MDLANTNIEIRERSLSQRVDLALRFVATRAWGVGLYAAMGVIPALAFNALLVWSLDPFQTWNALDWQVPWVLIMYLTWVESPLVMAPLVVFLGAALFRQPMTWRAALGDVAKKMISQIYVHGIVRCHLFWVALVLLAYANQSEVAFYSLVVFGVLFGSVFWFLRPYVDHIMYLERLPLLLKKEHPMTVGQRSSILHSADSGETMLESFINVLLSVIVFYTTYSFCLWAYYWVTFNTVSQDWFAVSIFAVAWWNAMVVATVLRFLGYLDARIRSEGWELDLRVRREAEQQAAHGVGQTRGAGSPTRAADRSLGDVA
ncbi:MAG: hypothetical protein JNL67_03895 [Planctomycetaceae bacterium]|nr:hypothetical protein [Planctomycetaceae bacterium]